MDRRKAIKRVGLLLGGTLSATYISTVLSGCDGSTVDTATAAAEWTAEFFDAKQIKLIADIANTIIPTTDTPGAKEAMVDRFIDAAFTNTLDKEAQDMFVAGLAKFDEDAQGFSDLDGDKQVAFVKGELEKAQAAEKGKPNFIASMKEATCFAFFRSEAGMTKVLQYEDVPGKWIGCAPLADVGGRTWAT